MSKFIIAMSVITVSVGACADSQETEPQADDEAAYAGPHTLNCRNGASAFSATFVNSSVTLKGNLLTGDGGYQSVTATLNERFSAPRLGQPRGLSAGYFGANTSYPNSEGCLDWFERVTFSPNSAGGYNAVVPFVAIGKAATTRTCSVARPTRNLTLTYSCR